jgi:hypothetical protein
MALFLLVQAKLKTTVVQGENGEYLESDKSDLHEFFSQAESPR